MNKLNIILLFLILIFCFNERSFSANHGFKQTYLPECRCSILLKSPTRQLFYIPNEYSKTTNVAFQYFSYIKDYDILYETMCIDWSDTRENYKQNNVSNEMFDNYILDSSVKNSITKLKQRVGADASVLFSRKVSFMRYTGVEYTLGLIVSNIKYSYIYRVYMINGKEYANSVLFPSMYDISANPYKFLDSFKLE